MYDNHLNNTGSCKIQSFKHELNSGLTPFHGARMHEAIYAASISNINVQKYMQILLSIIFTSCDVILCFSYSFRKLWIELFRHFLVLPTRSLAVQSLGAIFVTKDFIKYFIMYHSLFRCSIQIWDIHILSQLYKPFM